MVQIYYSILQSYQSKRPLFTPLIVISNVKRGRTWAGIAGPPGIFKILIPLSKQIKDRTVNDGERGNDIYESLAAGNSLLRNRLISLCCLWIIQSLHLSLQQYF